VEKTLLPALRTDGSVDRRKGELKTKPKRERERVCHTCRAGTSETRRKGEKEEEEEEEAI
jgi:uncharacterized membrane-anchored protein